MFASASCAAYILEIVYRLNRLADILLPLKEISTFSLTSKKVYQKVQNGICD